MSRPDVQVIRPPNTLAMKAKKDSSVPIAQRLSQADAAVAEFGKGFSKWGLDDIAGIEAALEQARQDPEGHEALVSDIFGRAMDLKSQGGSFGYTLISEIGDSLKRFTEGRKGVSKRDIDIIAAHVDAMRAVLLQGIRGEGGKVGRQIVAGLQQLTEK